MSGILLPTEVMNLPLEHMTDAQLKYAYAYCQGEVMRAAENGPKLDYYEKRRLAVENEMWRRRK